MAFYRLEPFGEEREDLRMGILASTIANVNRDPKVRRRAYQARDFIPVFGPEATDDEARMNRMKQMVEILNAAFGGKDLRLQRKN